LLREGKMTIMTTRMSGPLWEPPDETLETIAAVITSHWKAAAEAYKGLFWPEATSWLDACLGNDRHGESPAHHFARGGRLIR
jgi:hypothetical protein